MKKAYIVPSLANAGPINVVMDLVQIMMLRSNKGTPAVIVENVHIGAGAVVVKDIPVNVTVVGVLAKVISYDGAGNGGTKIVLLNNESFIYCSFIEKCRSCYCCL